MGELPDRWRSSGDEDLTRQVGFNEPAEKRVILHAALLLAVVVVADGKIETSYDKSHNYTLYLYHLGIIEEGETYQSLSVSASHDGEEPKKIPDNDTLAFLVYKTGPDWKYLKNHDVIVTEGRNRLKVLAKYESEINRKNHERVESIHFEMTLAEAKKGLESGNNWEIKIGREDPIPVGPVTRAKIKEFVEHIQSGPDGKERSKRKEDKPKKKGLE